MSVNTSVFSGLDEISVVARIRARRGGTESGGESVSMATPLDKGTSQGLQGMKAQLTPGFRCHQHPVLVPAREKLHGEHRGGLRAQVRVSRLSIGEAACQGADVVQVH